MPWISTIAEETHGENSGHLTWKIFNLNAVTIQDFLCETKKRIQPQTNKNLSDFANTHTHVW